MPKEAASKPKRGSRAQPYPPKQPAKRVPRKKSTKRGAKQKEKDESPSFRFIDLPPEIKLRIYGYFAVVDKVVRSEDPDVYLREIAEFEKRCQDVRDVKQTRSSLFWVSRQISKEWAPIFFSTTTIVVNPARSPDDFSKLSEEDLKNFQYTPAEFGDIFMKMTAESKLECVTKLKYIDFLDEKTSNLETGQGLASLLGVLNEHLPRLPSLAKVTYLAVFDRDANVFIPDEDAEDDNKAFERLDVQGQLGKLEHQALSNTGSGLSNNWKSQRKVHYLVTFTEQGLPCIDKWKSGSREVVSWV